MSWKIVVVEDEEILSFGTTLHLKSFGHDVIGTFRSGEETVEQIVDLNPDLVLMDIELKGDIDGIETVKQIKEKIDVPVIYLSIHSDSETVQRAESTNPFRCMNKPLNEEDLQFTIEMAIKTSNMEKRLSDLEQFQDAFNNLQCIMYKINSVDKRTDFFNDNFEKITGFKWNEIENEDEHFILPLIFAEDRKKLINALNGSFNLKKSFNLMYKIKTKNGEVKCLQEMNKPVLGDDGQVSYSVGVIFDVTKK